MQNHRLGKFKIKFQVTAQVVSTLTVQKTGLESSDSSKSINQALKEYTRSLTFRVRAMLS